MYSSNHSEMPAKALRTSTLFVLMILCMLLLCLLLLMLEEEVTVGAPEEEEEDESAADAFGLGALVGVDPEPVLLLLWYEYVLATFARMFSTSSLVSLSALLRFFSLSSRLTNLDSTSSSPNLSGWVFD